MTLADAVKAGADEHKRSQGNQKPDTGDWIVLPVGCVITLKGGDTVFGRFVWRLAHDSLRKKQPRAAAGDYRRVLVGTHTR